MKQALKRKLTKLAQLIFTDCNSCLCHSMTTTSTFFIFWVVSSKIMLVNQFLPKFVQYITKKDYFVTLSELL